MDSNRKKYVAREAIQALTALQRRDALAKKIEELSNGEGEEQANIVNGLIEIAASTSERIIDRIRAASVLQSLLGPFKLIGDDGVTESLDYLLRTTAPSRVSSELGDSSSDDHCWLNYTILLALITVSPQKGFSRLNELIHSYTLTKFGTDLLNLRTKLSRGGSQC